MAAPTPAVARNVPNGIKVDQGFPIRWVHSASATVDLWEISSKPPGIDGGDAIETSTQLNTLVHTQRPRALIKWTNGTIKCQYDADSYTDLMSLINVEGTITIFYPNGDTLCFYGYYKSFTPGETAEGEKPTADVEVVVTNWDKTNHVEAVPLLTTASGT